MLKHGARAGAARDSSVDPDTAAPVDCSTFLAALTKLLFHSPALSHQKAFLFSLSRNATCFDQDNTTGLDASDCHQLEKRMCCITGWWPFRLRQQDGPKGDEMRRASSSCAKAAAEELRSSLWPMRQKPFSGFLPSKYKSRTVTLNISLAKQTLSQWTLQCMPSEPN